MGLGEWWSDAVAQWQSDAVAEWRSRKMALHLSMARAQARRRSVGGRRRVLAGVLLGLGAVVAAAWVASGWWFVGYARGEHLLSVEGGVVHWQSFGRGDWAEGLQMGGIPSGEPDSPVTRVAVWIGIGREDGGASSFIVRFGIGEVYRSPYGRLGVWLMLWPMALVLTAVGGLVLRSGVGARRRAIGTLCRACGYDRAGLKGDARCPECGEDAGESPR